MKVKGRSLFVGSLATILLSTCVGFAAGGSHKSSERRTEVTFPTTTKLNNGSTLAAGTYQMAVPDNSQTPAVTFSQDGKVVATIEAKVVTGEKKNDATEIDSINQGDAQTLTSIHPAGWNEEIVFGSDAQDMSH